jgi:dTDP-4-dehydrorhamnose reductase
MELKEKTGISVLLQEAWERYRMPMALTEVHLHCHREEQLRWFKHVWNSCVTLRQEGVQIEALTTWAMLGSFGWNKLLTAPYGEYEAGMFDVRSGEPRPTALAGYVKKLTDGGADEHHLAVDKGWWVRPTRFFHRPLLLQNRLELTSQCRAPLLIIGRTGTLGRAFAQVCEQRFLRFEAVGREECDISDPASIDRTLEKYKPWAVINTAGYVRLDDAEYEPGKCFTDNTAGAQNLAAATLRYGMKLISFSSDLVFDGEKRAPYIEADEPNPVNVYGRSKAEAEKLMLSTNPDVLVDEENGIWHLSNNGEISWADFANEVADRLGLNRKYINPIRSSEFSFTAKRPLYSVLSSSRGIMLPSLDDALKRFTREKRQEKHMQKRERA